MEKKKSSIKKWIAALAIGELGRSVLQVNLYNRRQLTKEQRQLAYKEITITWNK